MKRKSTSKSRALQERAIDDPETDGATPRGLAKLVHRARAPSSEGTREGGWKEPRLYDGSSRRVAFADVRPGDFEEEADAVVVDDVLEVVMSVFLFVGPVVRLCCAAHQNDLQTFPEYDVGSESVLRRIADRLHEYPPSVSRMHS